MSVVDYKGKLVFSIDNKDFRAAGFLIHKDYDDEMQIMMIQSDRGWEFPGGKVEKEDFTLFDTAIRELVEETNGCIISELNEKFIKSKIDDGLIIQNNPELKEELKEYLSKSKNSINEMFNCCDYFVEWIPDYRFKYGLFFSQMPDSWLHKDEIYGEVELWENIPRRITWVSRKELLNIIQDESKQKFMMLTLNTFLKKKLIQWLENGGHNQKIMQRFRISYDE